MPHPAHRFTIGRFGCTVVTDGTSVFSGPGGPGFANATAREIAAALADYAGPRSISFNSLVIDTGAERLLVDTGSGPGGRENAGELLDNLVAAGIDPASIDLVVITHAHGDHVGGVADASGRPHFPNATVVISRDEWDWWTDPTATDEARVFSRSRLQAVADRVRIIEPGDEIAPGISAVDARGHTAGQIALLLESGDERLLFAADAVHHPIQMANPDWYFPFDQDAHAAVATRRGLFPRAVAEGLLVQTYHFPFPGLGHVHEDGEVWRWEPLAM